LPGAFERDIMKLKWTEYLKVLGLMILHDGLLFALFYFGWWTRPMGTKLPYQQALPGDYTAYWEYIKQFGVIALIEGAMIACLLIACCCLLGILIQKIGRWQSE